MTSSLDRLFTYAKATGTAAIENFTTEARGERRYAPAPIGTRPSFSARQSMEQNAARMTFPWANVAASTPTSVSRTYCTSSEPQTPHPFGQYQEPLHFDAQRLASVPRTFIDCVSPAWPSIAPMRRRVRSEPGWHVRELATGHDAMVGAAGPLTQMLLAAAAD